MSTIKFYFSDLCAFFTKYPSHLMVGMIPTDDESPEHIHHPRITIKQNGITQRIYREFAEINGDISLNVYPGGRAASRPTPRYTRDLQMNLDLLVDIEKTLYPNEKLNVDSTLCRARLHFRNGEFYTIDYITNVKFADLKTEEPCPHAPSEIAHKMGLNVKIEDKGVVPKRLCQ